MKEDDAIYFLYDNSLYSYKLRLVQQQHSMMPPTKVARVRATPAVHPKPSPEIPISGLSGSPKFCLAVLSNFAPKFTMTCGPTSSL